jgi:protein-disulfide isomerase
MVVVRPRIFRKGMRAALALAMVACVLAGCTPAVALPPAAEASSPTKTSDPAAPAVLDDIEVGFTGEGYPYRGAANAPVTLVEYSDYLCPYCARHAAQTVPGLLERYIRTGQVKWVFRDFPIASLHPTSEQGHIAAECLLAEQGAALYWQMHDRLFATQEQWSSLSDPSDYLAGLAQSLGADMVSYNGCIASGRAQGLVAGGLADGKALGFSGTPSFQFLSGVEGGPYTLVGAQALDTFAAWIDPLLAGQVPAGAAEQATAENPELPFWARPDGLAPDPARPGYTVAGDPYRGDPQAPLVVVEFSDYQCPPCAKHALEVQPALDSQFVATGDVLWVFKNLPLQENPQAPVAAAAAECAGEQGQFWEMHDLLFEKLADWAVDAPDVPLTALAASLGLDRDRFAACLSGRQALERVLDDLYDAKGTATVAPTFLFLYGGTGTIMRGSKPAEQFGPILQTILEQAKAGH